MMVDGGKPLFFFGVSVSNFPFERFRNMQPDFRPVFFFFVFHHIFIFFPFDLPLLDVEVINDVTCVCVCVCVCVCYHFKEKCF